MNMETPIKLIGFNATSTNHSNAFSYPLDQQSDCVWPTSKSNAVTFTSVSRGSFQPPPCKRNHLRTKHKQNPVPEVQDSLARYKLHGVPCTFQKRCYANAVQIREYGSHIAESTLNGRRPMATDHPNTMDSRLWSPRRTRKRDDSGDNRQINDEPKHEPEIPSREEPAGSLALESRNSSRSRFVRGRSSNENDGNDRISVIFNAIVKEIHSVISEHQTLQLKTLADVLEDNQSLVASQYTIPQAMINDQAIDFLQVLIDRKKRLEPKTKSSPKVEFERFVADRIVGCSSVLNQEPKFSTEIKERPICRICRQKRGFLVRPCACRGPQANVHIECLQRRLDETGENSCELCNHVYKAIHPPRIDLIPSMKFWYKFVATTSERKSINSDVASFISTLTIMVLWNLYVHTYCTEPRNDDNDQDVSSVIFNIGVKIVSVLGSILFAIRVVTKTNSHLKKWFSWYTQKKSVLALSDYME